MKRISLSLVLCTIILALLLTFCALFGPPRLVVKPDAVSQVDELLTRMTRDGTFSGSVLIGQDRVVFLNKGYGLADRAQGIPTTPQTRFHLGSMTKQFTAMGILILQSQGKLGVQDPICNHIASCPAAWQDITIHQLLTHTSGLSPRLDKTMDNAAIDQRVLIWWGEDDPAGLPMAEETRDALAHAQVEYVVVAKCGHFWHECPEQFYPRVRAFLGLAEGQD